MSLSLLYETLKADPSGHAFTVLPVAGRDDVLLGVDKADRPSIFVAAQDGNYGPPLRTAQLTLEVGQHYQLAATGGEARHERLHSLRCVSTASADIASFLIVVEALLASCAGPIDELALTSFFRSMVRLFTVAPAGDLASQRQGLWGELFAMRQERGFRFWAPSWHSASNRKFDFSKDTMRVDVKTAVGGERMHHVSHRQLYALDGESIVIASMLLRVEDAGLSLRSLIEEARHALAGHTSYMKIEDAVRQAGMELASETGPAYDENDASRSLSWFQSSRVPHFPVPEPPGVSDTRYRVDLSTVQPMPLEELEKWLTGWSA